MICIKCKKIVPITAALVHPKSNKYLFCPECKRLLIDFGQEFVRLSSPDKLIEYDRNPNPDITPESVDPFITAPQVDTRILECLDAIAIKPENIDARITLIKLYITKNDFKTALKEIVDLEGITGQDLTSMALLADVFAGAGNYKQAIQYCVKILKHNNHNIDARYNLGVALACLGNYSAAANQFIKIVKINPEHNEAKKSLELLKPYLITQESQLG